MKIKQRFFFIFFLTSLLFTSCRDSINNPNIETTKEEKPVVVVLKDIAYPNDRVIWEPGKTYEIKWEVTKNLDFVKLDLLKKFAKIATIDSLTENDGIYRWSIPSSFPGSHHYRIKLTLPNNDFIFSQSVEFVIQDTSKNIIVDDN